MDLGRHSVESTFYSVRPGVLKLPANTAISVRIDNRTSKSEYVHWHGFQVPARYDGTCEEQSEAVEGHGTLQYTLPPQNPGLYYVHSHAMTMHSLQQGPYSGQFTPVLVGDGGMSDIARDREIVLASHEWDAYYSDDEGVEKSVEQTHHLRIDADDEEGNESGWEIRYRHATLGGKPLDEETPVCVAAGERILFHIVNASATEPLVLHLPGHSFHIHALDGDVVPVVADIEVLYLGPGERASAIVVMNHPGTWILGSVDDEARAKGMGIVIAYQGHRRDPVWSAPAGHAGPLDYTRFSYQSSDQKQPDAEFLLERKPRDRHGFEQWAMTMLKESMPELHRPYRIALHNASDEDHPMHLHRNRFELKTYCGRGVSGLWKDTVVVPALQSVEIEYTPYDTEPSFFHCHNQMHMDCGMATILQATNGRKN